MKKSVKIVLAVIAIALAGAGGGYYLLQSEELTAVPVTVGAMEESLQLQAVVSTDDTYVISASTIGTITDIPFVQGMTIYEGEDAVLVDDSDYQLQLADQIASLQKQKSAVFSQGQSSQSEIKLRQQQLIKQMDDLRHEYDQQFGDGGMAELDVKAAKAAMEGARSDCDTALDANSKASNAGTPVPYSGTALGSLNYAYETAKANYQKALLMTSEPNKIYYQSMLTAYELQLETLTENGNSGASSINLAAAQIQLSIDTLKREQEKKQMSSPFDGIVGEIFVEEGSFVTENQPLMQVLKLGSYKLETWMLTEDVLNYQVGDTVEVVVPGSAGEGSTEQTAALEGNITFISPIAQPRLSSLGVEENRCKVEIAVDGLPDQMGPGYEVDVNFHRILRQETISIPVSALVTKNGESCVYKLVNTKKVLTSVETGIYSGGMVEITEGLTAADIVVLP